VRKKAVGVVVNENVVGARKLIEKVYGREGTEDR
jgi:hypothetical protein